MIVTLITATFLVGSFSMPKYSCVKISQHELQLTVRKADAEEAIVFARFIASASEPRIRAVSGGAPDALLCRVGDAVRVAGYQLYPITVAASAETFYEDSLVLTIDLSPYPDVSLPASVASAYGNMILNYEYDPSSLPQGLLIITPVSFYNAVLPLARWKEQKGWSVTVATLTQTGSSNTAIKNFITAAYNDSTPRPEYVLLIGDRDSLPAFTVPSEVNPSDHQYSMLDGTDIFSDLMVGRLSVSNVNELNTVVAKIIGYEKTPYTTDTMWYKRGLMVAADYPYDTMTTPVMTKRWVRNLMLDNGFSQVDTVYDPPVQNGVTPITNSVNTGVAFINYRGGLADYQGWDHPYFKNADLQAVANGWKLPVVTSLVCSNGAFHSPACFGEVWLRIGNPITPKGAVAFFGASSPTTHSRWNNCLDQGIYWGLLEEGIVNFGSMTYRGKLEAYMDFPLETDDAEFYFYTYNVLGDPSLEVWTGVPRSLNVTHASSISTGTNAFSVQVRDGANQPVPGALVSLYKEGEVKSVLRSNTSGMAYFQIGTSMADTLFVTVTKHNHAPYAGYCLVNNAGVNVGYASHTLSDAGGNNNGAINPGEPIQLNITLKNFGTSQTATGVSATLRSSDPLVTVTDSLRSFANMAPGASATAGPYAFQVSTGAHDHDTLDFTLAIATGQGSWTSVLQLDVAAPDLEYCRNTFIGGNGVLDPGESSNLTVTVGNHGRLTAANVSGVLRSLNPGVTVSDSLGTFGSIAIADSATNTANQFTVTASASLSVGHKIDLAVLLSGDSGLRDTLRFTIIIGTVTQDAPLGPDGYGYYAYDNTDTDFAEVPVYDWLELDPMFGGSGTALNLGRDQTKVITMPFTFVYRGTGHVKLSICSDGYAALDSTDLADMYNWPIISAPGPANLIAPFWDDLDPTATDSSRDVYYQHDAANHRFIVEWSRIQHIHNPTSPMPAELQTFEIILYDPAYHATQTGDGEIVFQYQKIQNDDSWHNYATVGIRDETHTDGLEYTYANSYPASAAPLANSRAVKFTTDQPDMFPGVQEDQAGARRSLVATPNPFSRSIRFEFERGPVRLEVFDAAGRCVVTLAASGPTIVWRGVDSAGRRLTPGVYFVRIADNEGNPCKIILLK